MMLNLRNPPTKNANGVFVGGPYFNRMRTVSIYTGLVCLAWIWGNKRQHDYLDRLSFKYFSQMPDDQLIIYDKV